MMALTATPILAAGIDWLEGLLPLAFVAFWIISQIVNVIRRVSGAGTQPQPARGPRRPLAPPPASRPAGDPRAELERQIDEFLRGSRPARSEPPRTPPRTLPKPPKPVADRARPPRPPVEAAPAPAVASRTASRVGSLENSSTVAAHVHDAFAHEIGHLHSPLAGEAAAGTEATRAGAPADEIARLLRSASTMRQLVVLHEVLERPVGRW